MKKITIILIIIILQFFNSCASTCMEYRSATTAARSEKNLNRAEDWAIKALASPECNPASDAYAPYFLATEVYLEQKKYSKMAEMLTIAEQRNPGQLLETPFKLGDTPVTTIKEGVKAYRDQEWVKVYNKVVEYIQNDNLDDAKDKIELATLIHPNKGENYFTLANILIQKEDTISAIKTLNKGVAVDSTNSMLHLLTADLAIENKDFDKAESSYLKAIIYSENPGPIMRNLLYVYIDMGNNQKAIDYADELIDKYPNDADIYYNVGVLYQRMAQEIESSSKNKFNKLNEMDVQDPQLIREIYTDFRKLKSYANSAKDYFYEASDLEQEKNLDTQSAISEMKKAVKQMDDIYIDSIRQIARSVGVELD